MYWLRNINLYHAEYIYILHSSPIFIQSTLQEFNLEHVNVFTSRMENSVDPNQLASRKPADQDTHTVFKKDISGLSMLRVKNERQHMISNNLAF